MAERQEHGFVYEKKLESEDPDFTLVSDEYTGKWDGYKILDSKKYPVSVKCIGIKGSIDFGDVRRQNRVNEDFILKIGFWSGDKDNIVENYEILIDKNKWNSYFGNVEIFEDLYEEMRHISNNSDDDDKWKIFRKKYSELYGKSIISLRFKRDHKNQKRIQCGFTKKNFENIILKDSIII